MAVYAVTEVKFDAGNQRVLQVKMGSVIVKVKEWMSAPMIVDVAEVVKAIKLGDDVLRCCGICSLRPILTRPLVLKLRWLPVVKWILQTPPIFWALGSESAQVNAVKFGERLTANTEPSPRGKV